MQTYFRRGAALAGPFLLMLFLIGCGPGKDDAHVRKIDSLSTELKTVRDRLGIIEAASLVYHALPPGKSKKIKVPAKAGRRYMQVCVKPDLQDSDIDSVVVRVNIVKGNKQVELGELKFGKKWPVAQAALRWNEKEAFDIVLVTTWYKNDGSTHLGTWCEAPDCTIPDSAKCSDLLTNVSTTRSTSTGSSTTTVSVDEQ
jgi:hypothetical protein